MNHKESSQKNIKIFTCFFVHFLKKDDDIFSEIC